MRIRRVGIATIATLVVLVAGSSGIARAAGRARGASNVPLAGPVAAGGAAALGRLAAVQRFLLIGPGPGMSSQVRMFDGGGALLGTLSAFGSFTGGVRVAAGDVNGDGTADLIVAPGPGRSPQVKIIDGTSNTVIFSFSAFSRGFLGGVFVAAGDVNGDGYADVVVGADKGAGPHVKVFDVHGGQLLFNFFAYAPQFTGGVRVAVGDVDGDRKADIVTGAGPGGSPHVKVFSGSDGSLLQSFFAYSPAFTGGVFVASGDLDGDGAADIVTGADAGAGPHVKAFLGIDPSKVLKSFFAYAPGFTGGVRVAVGDENGDQIADIVTGAGPGGGPHVKVFDGTAAGGILASFFAYSAGFTGGVYVAFGQSFVR
jgi:fibronectin-binding autotransporter adhesin